MLAFRINYDASAPGGLGTTTQLLQGGFWVAHSGRLVWDYDGLPAVPGDPFAYRRRSLNDLGAGFGEATAGDLKYDPGTGTWVYVFSGGAELYAQRTTSLASGKWALPKLIDTTTIKNLYALHFGYRYYPGLWYGTLGSRTGLYLFTPVPETPRCAPFFTGLRIVAANLEERTESTLSNRFHPVLPCRAFDTRLGGFAPAMSALTRRIVQIGGVCGVPTTARAVALNITDIASTSDGNLALYPGSGGGVLSSTINHKPGNTRANNSIMGLESGFLSVYNDQLTGRTDVVIDVVGYFE